MLFLMRGKWILILQCTAVALTVYWWTVLVFPELGRSKGEKEEMKLYFLDVGQGDAVLIETPNKERILVDAGKGIKVLNKLSEHIPNYIRNIEVAILTHPDADHIGGFPYVFNRYEVETIIHSFVKKDTSIYKKTMKAVEEEGANVFSVDRPYTFSIDGIDISILWPIGREVHEANAASITVLLQYGETDILLTGDAPIAVEEKLLELFGEILKDIEVVKAGHHGSKTATSEHLLDATTPDIIVYSAGKNNSYGHPHEQVYERVKEYERKHKKEVVSLETKDGTVVLCLTKHSAKECGNH